MLEFKKIEIEDYKTYYKFFKNSGELSCENSFVNLLVWQCGDYNKNYIAVCDNQLIIKNGEGERESFRLPMGDDFQKGMKLIEEYSGDKKPRFWVQEGPRYEMFKEYAKGYSFKENRDTFDYIYLQSDLSSLSGKKFHSKRNHISAFSKAFDWCYEEITDDNKADVLKCAETWYQENVDRMDHYMVCEKKGIEFILDNMDELCVKGGAVYVDGKVVAFTLGSPITQEVFDIHIEKALSEYAPAYAVINREFAKTLEGYKYLNREDDLGLEGLRKAKLSYKPHIILKKFSCRAE
jgi:hypothetical protein